VPVLLRPRQENALHYLYILERCNRGRWGARSGTLAGHTHGGQLSLEFYVNRGIGTIGTLSASVARPEITVLELSRT
jgi:hypothetical protein